MCLGKEICNMQGRRNKRQSNGAMFEMMTSKMTIDLNVLSVAGVRRRGDRPPSYVMVGGIYLVNMVRHGVLCLLVVKNGVGVAT